MSDLKIENLTALADWFEEGAPEWSFDMGTGFIVDDDAGRPIEESCGTAGCIAGAALSMKLHRMDRLERRTLVEKIPHDDNEADWDFVSSQAMSFLGLSSEQAHRLFTSAHAPFPCRPHHAATAIRRLIAGQDPWTEQTTA